MIQKSESLHFDRQWRLPFQSANSRSCPCYPSLSLQRRWFLRVISTSVKPEAGRTLMEAETTPRASAFGPHNTASMLATLSVNSHTPNNSFNSTHTFEVLLPHHFRSIDRFDFRRFHVPKRLGSGGELHELQRLHHLRSGREVRQRKWQRHRFPIGSRRRFVFHQWR